MRDNLGFLYYKKNYDSQTGKVVDSKNISNKITSADISSFPDIIWSYNKLQVFPVITTYPGFLLGSGYTHFGKEGAAENTENAFKIGFFFDHTTGMPVIPGSSIKGVLRSAFPQFSKDDLKILNNDFSTMPENEKSLVKAQWLLALIEEITNPTFNKENFFENYISPQETATKEDLKLIHTFEIELFDTARNVFYDSFPIEIVENNIGNQKRVFGTDSITPHIKEGKTYEEAMLTDPVPLKFLKVLPNVRFDFNFKLKDSTVFDILKKDKLILLFKKIILTLGLGAKTNVGYGQFREEEKLLNPNKTFATLQIGDVLNAKITDLKNMRFDLGFKDMKFVPRLTGLSPQGFQEDQVIKVKVESIGTTTRFSLIKT